MSLLLGPLLNFRGIHIGQYLVSALLILDKWTCPYQTGHQFPVKLMPLPSA